MANRIIGLDIGSYSIKVVHLDVQREMKLVGFDEELIHHHEANIPANPTLDGQPSPEGSEDIDAIEDLSDKLSEPTLDSALSESESENDVAGSQLEASDNESVSEQAWDESEWDESDENVNLAPWVRALRELAVRGNFDEGDAIITFLPDGQAMTIQLEVPFDSKSKVVSILPHLLADKLPVDPRSVTYDFMVTPSTMESGYAAIVGFARKDILGDYLHQLQALSIDPGVVGIPEFMLKYVADRANNSEHQSYAVVDIGHTFTRLLLVNNGSVVLARSIFSGGHHITEAIAERFGIRYEEARDLKHSRGCLMSGVNAEIYPQDAALEDVITQRCHGLIRDLRRTLQSVYARHRVQVEHLYLSGGSTQIKNLEAFIAQELHVDTELIDIAKVAQIDGININKYHTPSLALGISLAIQHADDRTQTKLINLRQQEFAYRGQSSYLRSQVMQLAAAVAILFILFAGVLYSKQVDYTAQRDAMRDAVMAQTDALFGERLVHQGTIQQMLAGDGASELGFVPRMSAYELMYSLVNQMPDDIELTMTRFEVDMDRNLVQITGVTEDVQSVDRLASHIEGLECLKEVRKDKLQVRGEGRTEFELHISSGCS